MIPLPFGAFHIVTVHNGKKKVITECFEIVTISDLEPGTILGTKKQVLLQVCSTNNLEGDHTYTFKKQSRFFY